jgi:Family of unknown function (DUF6982)
MEPVKVVVRYASGKIIKGFTQDFLPNKDRFHLHPANKPSGDVPAMEILVKDLKALFFVRDFGGDPQHVDRKKYMEGEHPQGRKVEVTFSDGEVMVGTTLGYDPNRPGFFIFPADPKCNNIRVFAVTTSVKKVRQL